MNMTQPSSGFSLANTVSLLGAIALCEAVGIVGGIVTMPNIPGWYAGLIKPGFTPPAWVFGPVWTILYLMMGISLFLLWKQRNVQPEGRTALRWFWIQLVINALWSPVFFGLHSPDLGLGIIILLWLALGQTLRTAGPVSRGAALILVPYWLWVTFASVLNFELYRLN